MAQLVLPILTKNKMNDWEKRYNDELILRKFAGEILGFLYEPFKIFLAYKTFYSPDFLVVHPDHFEIIEVKGFRRDDAMVKFKTAAKLIPWWEWTMLTWEKKVWKIIYHFD